MQYFKFIFLILNKKQCITPQKWIKTVSENSENIMKYFR